MGQGRSSLAPKSRTALLAVGAPRRRHLVRRSDEVRLDRSDRSVGDLEGLDEAPGMRLSEWRAPFDTRRQHVAVDCPLMVDEAACHHQPALLVDHDDRAADAFVEAETPFAEAR